MAQHVIDSKHTTISRDKIVSLPTPFFVFEAEFIKLLSVLKNCFYSHIEKHCVTII